VLPSESRSPVAWCSQIILLTNHTAIYATTDDVTANFASGEIAPDVSAMEFTPENQVVPRGSSRINAESLNADAV
jgi:hypothetical protein